MICSAIALIKKEIPNIWNMKLSDIWSKNIHSDFKNVTVKQLALHNGGIDSPNDNVEFTNNIKKYYQIEKKLEKLDGQKLENN